MQVTIRVDDASREDEISSLHDWFRTDRALRRVAQIEMVSSTPPIHGAQGTLLDAISLVVGSSFSAASLGLAIATWRSTRPQQPTVTVERPDGIKVTISDASSDEAQRLVERLLSE
ncbi:hypothetical protein JW613_35285 [Streptomyces smyrnaeus]|uniref:Uncharacterized protein n=1 Tax=Streptomyces smyrnaeus TaxID=1387713 RepID=A0ABS3Y769_9ACTN|nr:hypothetical protein [Streptomyces smyrnaeus]MBO8203505.1 hypothetical protein [Streptomyces smyrnaeus]